MRRGGFKQCLRGSRASSPSTLLFTELWLGMKNNLPLLSWTFTLTRILTKLLVASLLENTWGSCGLLTFCHQIILESENPRKNAKKMKIILLHAANTCLGSCFLSDNCKTSSPLQMDRYTSFRHYLCSVLNLLMYTFHVFAWPILVNFSLFYY